MDEWRLVQTSVLFLHIRSVRIPESILWDIKSWNIFVDSHTLRHLFGPILVWTRIKWSASVFSVQLVLESLLNNNSPILWVSRLQLFLFRSVVFKLTMIEWNSSCDGSKTPEPHDHRWENIKVSQRCLGSVHATTTSSEYIFSLQIFFIFINTYLYKEKEKITHNLKLFSSPQKGDEQRPPSSYFFIRCGDSSSAFPESVTDQWAQRFIHQESQLHRLFILPRRPTSEARPIKVSHFCPDACHLTQINQKYPSCLALFFMCHLSWFLCLCSITFLTSNEEWIFFFGILWCDPQVKAANEMHILELSQYTKSKEYVRGAKTKPCVNSTLPHVNKMKFPRLSHEQHKSTDVRKKCLYLLNCRIQTQLDSCHYSVHSAKHTVCTSCCSSVPDDWLTMLTVRFRLGTRPMPQSLFSSFIFFWPFKSGSCVTASHSTNIFPNRNLMTQGNLCFILALP